MLIFFYETTHFKGYLELSHEYFFLEINLYNRICSNNLLITNKNDKNDNFLL